MADLQLSEKLVLKPLVKVDVVKQLIRCQSHRIVHCGQEKCQRHLVTVALGILNEQERSK